MDNLYTAKAKQVLKNAEEIASELNHSYIGTEHILAALISVEDCSASIILRNNKVEYDNIVDLIEKLVAPSAGIEVLDKDIFTPRVKEMLEYAKNYTGITGDKQVGTNHILLALLREKEGVATRLLNTIGVNVRKIYSDILEVMGVAPSEFKNEINAIFGDNNGNSKPDFISQYSVDLTRKAMNGEMDPVIGREKEILRVIQILSRRTKNNPCLVGEPGVGKTAIVEGIAMRIANGMVPDTVKNKRVLTLDVASMVAGSKYRGEFEERIKRIINEVKEDKNILLFLDEIHTIIGAGGAEGSMDAANILKPALSRGEIQIIGATTLEEYRKYFEKDAALERRFQPVKVEAPSA